MKPKQKQTWSILNKNKKHLRRMLLDEISITSTGTAHSIIRITTLGFL